MRIAFIPFLLWLGVLQLPVFAAASPSSGSTAVETISAALALTGLTAAVFRLGILREQMSNTTARVATELSRFRDDLNRGLDGIDHRVASIESFLAQAAEQRVSAERWQAQVDVRLETHERRLDARDAARDLARDVSRGELAV